MSKTPNHDGPFPVSPLPKPVELTGKLFPWDGLQPVLARMPGSPHLYLPLFSKADNLLAFMTEAKIAYRSVKQIDDGPEFLTSFDEHHRQVLRVILDPYFLPNGRVRFTEVLWD